MKRGLYYSVISFLLLSMVLSFVSCKKEPTVNSDSSYEYTPSGEVNISDVPSSEDENTTSDSQTLSGGKYTVNDDWKSNFRIVYVLKNDTKTVEGTEKKCDSAYIVEEKFIVENKKIKESVQYCKVNGTDIDWYKIIEEDNEYEHTVYEDTEFVLDDSRFIEFFYLKSDVQLTLEKNALYMRDENVAGRLCCRYLIGEYKDGERTKHIYIWIDVQYGFIAKLEVYDSDGKLLESREVKEFSVGDMTEEDVYFDISRYEFTEVEG